jgi:hypothetical protein
VLLGLGARASINLVEPALQVYTVFWNLLFDPAGKAYGRKCGDVGNREIVAKN